MGLNHLSRSFVTLVQHDLLELTDAGLFRLVHQWVETAAQTHGSSDDALNNTRAELGYTLVGADVFQERGLGSEPHVREPWRPPLPSHLRVRLTEMDVDHVLQQVISVAFQSLHATHPEWGDGMIFYAQLANYVRQYEQKTRKAEPEVRS